MIATGASLVSSWRVPSRAARALKTNQPGAEHCTLDVLARGVAPEDTVGVRMCRCRVVAWFVGKLAPRFIERRWEG